MSYKLFKRNVQLKVITDNNTISIPKDPLNKRLKIDFNIVFGGTSKSSSDNYVEIYNINSDTQNFIEQNQKDASIVLLAGYGDDISVFFTGGIDKIETEHKNDFIFKILLKYSADDFKIKHLYKSFVGDISIRKIIKNYLDYCHVSNLYFNLVPDKIVSNYNLHENLEDTLNTLLYQTGVKWKVENSIIIFYTDESLSKKDVFMINSSNGLIGYPKKNGDGILCNILFNPNIRTKDLIEIQLENDADNKNGVYVVNKCTYKGSSIDKDMIVKLECSPNE